jgi:hypothetical protein
LRTRQEVVGETFSTLAAQFAFQSSALSGDPLHKTSAIQMVRSYNGRAVTGFLLQTSCENHPEAMGAAGDPPLALMRSIQNGMRKNDDGKYADYIEIQAPDVEADDLQPVLRWGASYLLQLNQPAE